MTHMTQENGPLHIIYIASHGHSGSTLADIMISAHPDIISLGEINMLPIFARMERDVKESMRCACEIPCVLDCPFWHKVNTVLKKEYGLDLTTLDLESDDPRIFKEHNLALFQALAKISGKRCFVDSSKSLKRLLKLRKCDGIELYPVHLIRPPLGLISSLLRKNLSPNIFHAIGVYCAGLFKAFCLLLFFKHKTLYYDRLVSMPEQTLDRLLSGIGLSYNPVQKDWAAQERHTIGGNGSVKFVKESRLILDNRWKKELTGYQKILISVLTFPVQLLCTLKTILYR